MDPQSGKYSPDFTVDNKVDVILLTKNDNEKASNEIFRYDNEESLS